MANDSRIHTEVVLKLFDTLKDANDETKASINKQTEAIVFLSDMIRDSVKPEDVKAAIDEHHKHSGEHLDNIDTCTETIEDNSTKILGILKTLCKRVNTMILVVIISFSLMVVSYIFVRSAVEKIVNNRLDEVQIESVDSGNHNHQELLDQIEKLRKELEDGRYN